MMHFEELKQEVHNPYCIIKSSPVTSYIHNIYLLDDIDDPSHFVSLLELLQNATQEDEINLHINSYGGNAATTFQIVNAIRGCRTPVIAHLTCNVMSGASLIAIACDGWYVSPYVNLMCHAPSGGQGGKQHEVLAAVKFNETYFKECLESVYLPFLTKKEFAAMLEGQDFYFGHKEVLKRLGKVNQHRLELQQEESEDE